MINQLNRDTLSFLIKGSLPSQNESAIQEAKQTKKSQNFATQKDEILNTDQIAAKNRNIGAGASYNNTKVETIVREKPKIGRNEKVTIKNIKNGTSKKIKFKQAEILISKGEWVLVDY
jgi:preprotein translocase subunit SecA